MGSWDGPQPFAKSLLETLVEALDLVAASFWQYSGAEQPLRLRDVVGIDPAAYRDFELELHHYPGLAILRDDVLSLSPEELRDSKAYRDQSVLGTAAVGGMVTGPLTGAAPAGKPIGALCLYPRNDAARTEVQAWLRANAEFLGRLYVAALERHAMGLRREVVRRVAFRKDLESLQHNFLRAAVEMLSVDAAQLWILEPIGRRYYLSRATGTSPGSAVHDVPAFQENASNPLARAMRERRILTHSTGRPLPGLEDLLAPVPHQVCNASVVPLEVGATAKLQGKSVNAIGVIVLVNHRAAVDGVSHLAQPSWEDQYLAKFACEMLSVLVYQALKAEDREYNMERLLHGAQRGLQEPFKLLTYLDDRGPESLSADDLHRHVSDSLFHIEDLLEQFNRNVLFGQDLLPVEAVNLFPRVLQRLVRTARRAPPIAPATSVIVGGFDGRAASPWYRIPAVSANEMVLRCVFRNLIDNAFKYARKDPDLVPGVWFSVRHSPDGRRLVVSVADNGIGIPDEDRKELFDDGFRGVRAMAHVPQGVGRGLYDCRTLLRRTGGDIHQAEPPPGLSTCFDVELPVYGIEE